MVAPFSEVKNVGGNFGAVSASWLISKEDFFAPLIDIATSLRFAVVMVSSEMITFRHSVIWRSIRFASQYNGGSAGYPDTLPNPELGWEQTKTTDIGLDVTFLNRP